MLPPRCSGGASQDVEAVVIGVKKPELAEGETWHGTCKRCRLLRIFLCRSDWTLFLPGLGHRQPRRTARNQGILFLFYSVPNAEAPMIKENSRLARQYERFQSPFIE